MGQVCSRRQKRKLSENIQVVSTTSTEVQSVSEVDVFIKDVGLDRLKPDVVGTLQDVLTDANLAHHRLNVYLVEVGRFGERIRQLLSESAVDLRKVRFPAVGFDFVQHAALLPSTLSTCLFKPGSRPELVGWYIQQATCTLEKEVFLAVVIRMMLGKRPKADLPPTETDNLSESLAILLVVHHLCSFMEGIGEGCVSDPLEAILSLSGDQFIGSLLNKPEHLHAVRKILTSTPSLEIFLRDVQTIYPQIPLRLLIDLSKDPSLDELIVSHTIKEVSVPVSPRRDCERLLVRFREAQTLAQRSAVSLEDRVIQDPDILTRFVLDLVYVSDVAINAKIVEEVEKLYQLLPSHLEGDSGLMDEADMLERHIELARILTEVFRFTNKISFETLRERSKEESPKHRGEILLIGVVRSGLRQWTDTSSIFTHKTAESWWNNFVGNVELIAHSFRVSNIVHVTLFRELLKFLHEEVILVEREKIFSILRELCENIDNSTLKSLARELLFNSDLKETFSIVKHIFPSLVISEELRLIDVSNAVKDLLLSAAMSPEGAKGVLGLIHSTVGDKQSRNRLRYLVAHSVESQEYRKFKNLLTLESMMLHNKQSLFTSLFLFNPNAFFETSKIKSLCRIVDVVEGSNRDHCWVLHLACVAYILVKETEGSLSIIKRLTHEYAYPDAWRLVRVYEENCGVVSKDIKLATMKLCPSSELPTFVEQKHQSQRPNPVKRADIDLIKRFPNLGDAKEVESYIDALGEENGSLTFEHAKILVSADLAWGDNQQLIESLTRIASIDCF
jgi:hypothetical protein